ncbi:MAG: SulP family inorganic anion transporter [Thermoleophilia bacterium]
MSAPPRDRPAPEQLAPERAQAPPGGYGARRFVLADVIAGLSVALVLIPQSLAYAALAGMPPERGLYAAALPLLVAAPLASSPYLQTGPVAVTALLTFGALSSMATPGSDEYVALGLALALVVGAVRLAIGLARAGVIAYLMSQPMLIGFIPAAAILIFASQLPTAVGAQPPDGDLLVQAAWSILHPAAWELASALVTVGVLVAVLGGRRLHPLFPGVLVAAVGAIAFSELSGYSGPRVGELAAGLPPVSLDLPWAELPRLLVSGTIIAVVGYAEVASIARAFASQDRERWSSDREFVSQGAANVAAAFSGGFPVGGSFSRSSLNRIAGGHSRWSGAVTGLVVLVALLFAGALAPLPEAVLGAAVLAAVVPLIRPRRILRLWGPSRPAFLIAATTFVATLVLAPHVEQGVLVGVGLSIAVHLWRELRIDSDVWFADDVLHVRPRGVLWFGAAQALQDRVLDELASQPGARRLVLHLDALGRLDITGAFALRAVLEEARHGDIAAQVAGVQPRDRRLVDGVVESVRSV